VTRAVRQVKDFQKVTLLPGEAQRVSFGLNRAHLEFLVRDRRSIVEPGEFDIWIAPSAEADGLHGSFALRAGDHALPSVRTGL